jgi:hypothetical protein
MTEIVSPPAAQSQMRDSIQVRRAVAADLSEVIALDEAVTGIAKAAYWQDVFERYGERRLHERFFLVAEAADEEPGERIMGLVIGEIRA